jgi:hypothetical protein
VLGQTIPANFILLDSSNVGGMEAVTSLEMRVPVVPVQWQVKPLPILSVVSAMQLRLLPEVATVALYYKQVEWNAGAVGAMDRWETRVFLTRPLQMLQPHLRM